MKHVPPHSRPDPAHLPDLPDLHDPAERERLTRALPAVIRMLDAWHIDRKTQAELLTLSIRTVQRVIEIARLPDLNRDQLMRMSLLTGIYVALHILHDEDTANRWMTRPNRRLPFGGRTPLAYALDTDIPGLLTIRRLLDAERSGQVSVSPESRRQASRLPQPDIRLEE